MSAAPHAHSLGIGYQRMVTTNADLRVEFLDDRIYAVPSAHRGFDWTPLGGYPYLGYLVRFGPNPRGRSTGAGDWRGVAGPCTTICFRAARWEVDRFAEHLLERHPAQRFKVFQCGEAGSIPGE